jgi:hypothetical protein
MAKFAATNLIIEVGKVKLNEVVQLQDVGG